MPSVQFILAQVRAIRASLDILERHLTETPTATQRAQPSAPRSHRPPAQRRAAPARRSSAVYRGDGPLPTYPDRPSCSACRHHCDPNCSCSCHQKAARP